MVAQGWTKSDFRLAEEMPVSAQSLSLCHGWVQAVTNDAGHPDQAVDKLQTLKGLQPARRHLDPARMLRDGLSAPLHDGAKRYFRERALM